MKDTLISHLVAFVLSNTKRISTNFMREDNGFFNYSIYCGNTDSLFIEKNYWDFLHKATLVGENLC